MKSTINTKGSNVDKKTRKSPLIVAVIPARGGSKRVPRKNIKLMAGKPMIYYMLDAALKSKRITHVAFSSEDDEILAVANKLTKRIKAHSGKSVYFIKRPKKYALDKTPTRPVVQHAIQYIEKKERITFDYSVLLQPNSPLIVFQDIDNCIDILVEKRADSVWSVFQDNSLHPIKMKKLLSSGRLAQMVPSMPETIFRRQDLHDTYKRNGGIYATTRELPMAGEFTLGFFGGRITYPYFMPEERSVDIDTYKDFLLAEMLIKKGYRRYFVDRPSN